MDKKIISVQTGEPGAGVPISHWFDGPQEMIEFVSDLDVDADGSGGNPDHDPCFANDTTLHFQGKALNAQLVPFIVVPPIVCTATKGMVLGSLVRCTNLRNNKSMWAVVGDIGPSKKSGEGSPALCVGLGLSGNANHGGTDDKIIKFEIFVGKAALLGTMQFELKRYGT